MRAFTTALPKQMFFDAGMEILQILPGKAVMQIQDISIRRDGEEIEIDSPADYFSIVDKEPEKAGEVTDAAKYIDENMTSIFNVSNTNAELNRIAIDGEGDIVFEIVKFEEGGNIFVTYVIDETAELYRSFFHFTVLLWDEKGRPKEKYYFEVSEESIFVAEFKKTSNNDEEWPVAKEYTISNKQPDYIFVTEYN